MHRKREIRPASRMDCAPFIIGIHYAARWPSVSKAWALWVDGVIEGVVTYGRPSSAPLRSGICGPDYATHVWELNRLCLRGNAKNDASWLVSRSLNEMGDAIIVSYADTSQGHLGKVYQACNFIYTGLSAKRTDWHVAGQEGKHGQTIADQFRGVEGRAAAARAFYGDAFSLVDRPRKHRYVYVTGSRKFRRGALASIRYKIEGYPK